jgi:hypothetical protein
MSHAATARSLAGSIATVEAAFAAAGATSSGALNPTRP